jgi:hypothetical protein
MLRTSDERSKSRSISPLLMHSFSVGGYTSGEARRGRVGYSYGTHNLSESVVRHHSRADIAHTTGQRAQAAFVSICPLDEAQNQA